MYWCQKAGFNGLFNLKHEIIKSNRHRSNVFLIGNRMEDDIISDIFKGRDISVILKNRAEGAQYIESYLLKNLVVSEGKFWGKLANVHPPVGHEQLPQMNPLAYAYNNFSPVVCTMSLAGRMERYYSADAYSEIKFLANNRFKKIWCGPGGEYSAAILESVASGLKMKALIESVDGYTYVMPLHTFEVYEKENDFIAETEFDGYPERFRLFKDIEVLGGRFTKFMKENPGIPYASTDFDFSKPYFLSSFLIKKDSILHRMHDQDNKVHLVDFKYRKVEVWVECD